MVSRNSDHSSHLRRLERELEEAETSAGGYSELPTSNLPTSKDISKREKELKAY